MLIRCSNSCLLFRWIVSLYYFYDSLTLFSTSAQILAFHSSPTFTLSPSLPLYFNSSRCSYISIFLFFLTFLGLEVGLISSLISKLWLTDLASFLPLLSILFYFDSATLSILESRGVWSLRKLALTSVPLFFYCSLFYILRSLISFSIFFWPSRISFII